MANKQGQPNQQGSNDNKQGSRSKSSGQQEQQSGSKSGGQMGSQRGQGSSGSPACRAQEPVRVRRARAPGSSAACAG